ncbi:thiolase family protein, partial [Nguyenibacter vanlangensis]|nr:acetyl-CoA C-acyltransferase [Nguyenibacter vanlangensis]
MKNIVVAGFARSPFHPARRGALAGMRPDDLLAQIFRGLVERSGIDAADIEDALVGCAMPEGEQGLNLGRLAALLAGLPLSVAGATINRFCGSSMSAIHMAAGAILAGAGDLFLCGGVESMSRVPIGGFNPLPNPALARLYPGAYADMGTTAETLARKYEISRAEQEAFALRSQARARAAIQAGHLADEIIPVTTPKGEVVADDGCPRPDSTAEGLAALKPAFD